MERKEWNGLMKNTDEIEGKECPLAIIVTSFPLTTSPDGVTLDFDPWPYCRDGPWAIG